MTRLISCCKVALLLAAAFACCMVGTVCIQIEGSNLPAQMTGILARASQLEAQAALTAANLNATLDHLNRPCGRPPAGDTQPCGTLAQAGKVLADSHDLIIQSQMVEAKQAALLDQELPPLIARANLTLENLNVATTGLQPIEANAAALLTEATARTHDLQPLEANAAALLADPRIVASLTNLQESTAALAVTSKESAATMASVQAIAADGQQEVHSMLHPKPLTSIANWTLKIVHAMGGWF